jgi:hypothetical protein
VWSDGKENRDDGILGAALGPAAAQTMLRRSRGIQRRTRLEWMEHQLYLIGSAIA